MAAAAAAAAVVAVGPEESAGSFGCISAWDSTKKKHSNKNNAQRRRVYACVFGHFEHYEYTEYW